MLRHALPFVLSWGLALPLIAVDPPSAEAQRRQRRAAEDAPSGPRVTLADMDEILPRLQSANPDEVREAIDLLVIVDRPQVVPPLAELLRSGQPDRITDRALEALRGLAHPNAIEVLTEFTNHRRVGARRRAYQALAAIDDERVRPLLERGLRDSDRTVRGAAALALGEIGAKPSLDLLFHAFERGVVEAAIAIGKLGDEGSVERYSEFLGREPLGVMLSGYEEYLGRSDIDLETKAAIVDRLGEVAGVMVRRFLQSYLNQFPSRIRDQEVRELFERVEETIARIPEEAAGETIGGGQ
ncbi:MAG TPA: HEAT repeat domain-containing protein [Polyangiaceae bacterium LLY-WYZ-15_(1-7)]|nr:HEAT repeat domain-containing protein [Polyangiaceae bacterium LLY-WYZ-15_(1-7)]HJL10867.1 HEAT repeat domain-containing protein [Polyangiaceae bacterium LLY-WYZ-15_(1-7)]HJL24070.1 HEAT repeat domain-containing protein [Polyangiaceae bacterium LLY-WYZ-15_(1-7)]HJL32551.1 HEAT repeat domain-containing protein [Polyangiaceae bacterium LLY-WYZ-15_(1-7)]HJL39061.1 HEAT repeat domain-containing protein [Polyangiaceae bacterium LLY-WYZ-15_(1-7)]